MIKHETLKRRQAWPIEKKIRESQIRIRDWYESWDGNVYVSFSGGLDSTVMLDVVRDVYPDVPAVFSNTGLEYPEVVSFAKKADNLTIEGIFQDRFLPYPYVLCLLKGLATNIQKTHTLHRTYHI